MEEESKKWWQSWARHFVKHVASVSELLVSLGFSYFFQIIKFRSWERERENKKAKFVNSISYKDDVVRNVMIFGLCRCRKRDYIRIAQVSCQFFLQLAKQMHWVVERLVGIVRRTFHSHVGVRYVCLLWLLI